MKHPLFTFFKRTALVLIILFSLAASNNLFAQKAIQLTNIETSKKLKPITTGTRVVYLLKPVNGKPAPLPITGILSEITPSNLTINGVTVNISDLAKIGKKNKGSGIGSFLLSGFGTAIVVGAIKNQTREVQPACSGCIVVTEGEDKAVAGTIILSGIGVGMNILSINKAVRNSARNLAKWKLEIIDLD